MSGLRFWMVFGLLFSLFVLTCFAVWLNLTATQRGYAVHELYEEREAWLRRRAELQAEVHRLRAPTPLQHRYDALRGDDTEILETNARPVRRATRGIEGR
ncbi:MAG: hypothetical protein RL885_14835 [Planctomycetota bacterium]